MFFNVYILYKLIFKDQRIRFDVMGSLKFLKTRKSEASFLKLLTVAKINIAMYRETLV